MLSEATWFGLLLKATRNTSQREGGKKRVLLQCVNSMRRTRKGGRPLQRRPFFLESVVRRDKTRQES